MKKNYIIKTAALTLVILFAVLFFLNKPRGAGAAADDVFALGFLILFLLLSVLGMAGINVLNYIKAQKKLFR